MLKSWLQTKYDAAGDLFTHSVCYLLLLSLPANGKTSAHRKANKSLESLLFEWSTAAIMHPMYIISISGFAGRGNKYHRFVHDYMGLPL